MCAGSAAAAYGAKATKDLADSVRGEIFGALTPDFETPDLPPPPAPAPQVPEDDEVVIRDNSQTSAASRRGSRLGTSALRIPLRNAGLNQGYGSRSGGTGMNLV